MIFRFTNEAQKRLKTGKLPQVDESIVKIDEWYVTVFYVQRVKYILTTNAETLYSVVSFGKGITTDSSYFSIIFEDIFEQMKIDDLEFQYHKVVFPSIEKISMAKTNNRSILGSMNDFLFQLKYSLEELSIRDASTSINESPMSYINMDYSINRMRNYKNNN